MVARSEFFNLPNDQTDGYLRINTQTYRISKSMHPVSDRGLVFVDIEGVPDPDIVIHALHQEPLFTCESIIFRWPYLGGEKPKRRKAINAFLDHEPISTFLAGCGVVHVGVMQFALGALPTIDWRGGVAPTNADGEGRLMDRALRCEIRALLEYGHAIWRPTNYHYQLPSGDHTDSFIRFADAFRTPRDVEVIATWFLQYLVDNIAVVLDTASLIPLVSEFRRLLAAEGATIAGSETLDNYPSTSLEIQEAIQSIGQRDAVLAIMSVNASGRYKSLLAEAIRFETSPSLVVLIDKKNAGATRGHLGAIVGEVHQSSWVSIGRQSADLTPLAAGCPLCLQNGVSQTVRIDSRSFNAFALPQDNLLTPDVKAARAVRSFFDLCDEHGAIELNSRSTEYIRQKQPPMGVKMRLDRLVAQESFHDLVIEKMTTVLPPCEKYDQIVVSDREMKIAGFNELVDKVARRFGTARAGISRVSVPGADDSDMTSNQGPEEASNQEPDEEATTLAASRRPLIFCLGSVSGWLLRRLQVHVQNEWHDKAESAGEATAVVVHARSITARKWDNLEQSFEKRLHALWHVYLPDITPHADEVNLLKQSNIKQVIADSDYRNKVALAGFFEKRLALEAGVSPITESNVLWFPTPTSRLRNTSVYGTRINALTTFAAVAAAIQHTRQDAQVTDPRWPVFDFVSMGRSYFDGVLIACMLRWCAPSEVWWGTNPAERKANIEWLIRNTRDPDDQGILYSELIIGAVQGKIPDFAIESMCETIAENYADWTSEFLLPILAALVLLGIDHPEIAPLIAEIDAHVPATDSEPQL
ncbi:hypothetical protein ACXDF8_26145 [Mycolicibacterium sp. CBM1]